MKRWMFIHRKQGKTGYMIILKTQKWTYAILFGCIKSIWQKPRFVDKDIVRYGFEFGLLFLYLRVHVM